MRRTYENGLAWSVNSGQPGTRIISHGGGTGGYQSFVGFDEMGRRGVVVLSSGRRIIDVGELGNFLLKNAWQSDQHPLEIKLNSQVPRLLKRNAAIKLDTGLLDAVTGEYEFAPNTGPPPFTGMKLTIWREGGRLVGKTQGENSNSGAFDIYPESETNFLIEVNGARLTFIKGDKGAVMSVVYHETGIPDIEGKKVTNPPQ
jgi:hypothetical protein